MWATVGDSRPTQVKWVMHCSTRFVSVRSCLRPRTTGGEWTHSSAYCLFAPFVSLSVCVCVRYVVFCCVWCCAACNQLNATSDSRRYRFSICHHHYTTRHSSLTPHATPLARSLYWIRIVPIVWLCAFETDTGSSSGAHWPIIVIEGEFPQTRSLPIHCYFFLLLS